MCVAMTFYGGLSERSPKLVKKGENRDENKSAN